MATRQYVFANGLEIRFHQDSIRVESMHGTRKPDQSWSYVDLNDHAHVWKGDKLPTLYEKVTGTTWVGDEHDAMEVEVTEMRCKICDETVEPKYVTDYTPVHVPGPSEYTLRIAPNMMTAEYRIPDEDVGALIAILQRMFDRG